MPLPHPYTIIYANRFIFYMLRELYATGYSVYSDSPYIYYYCDRREMSINESSYYAQRTVLSTGEKIASIF